MEVEFLEHHPDDQLLLICLLPLCSVFQRWRVLVQHPCATRPRRCWGHGMPGRRSCACGGQVSVSCKDCRGFLHSRCRSERVLHMHVFTNDADAQRLSGTLLGHVRADQPLWMVDRGDLNLRGSGPAHGGGGSVPSCILDRMERLPGQTHRHDHRPCAAISMSCPLRTATCPAHVPLGAHCPVTLLAVALQCW